ncbi:MAG: D12 class N6 adenine-specific DNA methyltransferase [Candidatus Syntrophoarchaeum butanivorans]|uniref:D12 class N6 adenine-specific DNA methyltransferase n=1 Tax=Candidatus Syntropharchaeum butanivorans TaxID=1839936 RepID=A0A1F2P3E9_9EURY|nr:MAG: D12 class N6 adenine-specific DNA methyltransferase [Candidatus Syntrophoarchaeum butanivorans]
MQVKELSISLSEDENIEIEEVRSYLVEEMKKGKKSGKLLAIRWYGGKFSHLDWLLPLLPKCHHFCEPFGGSAAVLLNREPSPVETYNDIDGDVATFFRVLRDKPEELIEKLVFTPFSREELRKAYEMRRRKDLHEVERARLFFIRAEQVRIGLAQTSTAGRWAWCKLTSRRGMSGAVSRWLNRIDALWAVAERLRRVQIENRDAFEVMLKYDSPQTLFYLDPPYPHDSRGDINAYGYEMTEKEHEKLAEILHSIKAKAAISGYLSPLTKKLYSDWTRIDAPTKIIHSAKKPRTESLWINYNIEKIGEETIQRLKEMGCKFHVRQ